MSTAASTLKRTRNVFHGRSLVDTRSVAFVAYSGVLVVLIALTPLVRALMLALMRPATLSVLDSPGTERVAGLFLGACLALLPAIGGVFGPAFIRHPFLAHVLMRADLSRDTVLARPLLLSIAVFSALAACACALLSGALVLAGRSEIVHAAAFVSGAVCLSLVASVVWLAGQRLGRRGAWAGSALLIGAVAWTAVFPEARALTPWGWVASIYPMAAGSAWQLPALAVSAGVSACALPFLMRSMPGQEVIDQAIRWNIAVTTARGGDPTASVATFRALPGSGRSWVAVPHASVSPWVFLRRDLVGACRTPVRFATAIIGLVCAGVIASPIGLTPSARMAACGAAMIIGFVSLGALTDGIRHAAEAFIASPLYGFSPWRLVRLHSLLPLTASVVAMAAGFALTQPSSLTALALILWSAGHAALLRVFDSAKGALSPSLLSPIPTPFGDLSALVILGWNLDALLLAGATGVMVSMSATYSFGVATTVALCTSALVTWMTRRRFHRM